MHKQLYDYTGTSERVVKSLTSNKEVRQSGERLVIVGKFERFGADLSSNLKQV